MTQVPYWMLGTRISGVEIIGVARTSERASERVYQIRHDCCGRLEELGHEVIRRRIRERVVHCATCGRRIAASGPRTGEVREHAGKSFRLIAEMPADERPKVPSAAEVLALWERANARVGRRA